jgi:hypothetical protein
MYFEDIELSIEDVLSGMSKDEKVEMYKSLKVEVTGELTKDFSEMMPSDQKRFLCNALGVPSYHDNEGLRQKLEAIINAL